MANLTIRGLDEAIKTSLRLEAARRGHSMEETARQILRSALIDPEEDAGSLGSRIHQYFAEVDAVERADGDAAELVIPERSMPRLAPDFADVET